MALPPCLPLFQFMIDEKNQTISCHLYQRSADAFLGVPFDIASYSLLTCMIGKLTGYRPKELIHSFGDLHIYINHLEQVKIQLGRKVLTPPKLIIKRIPNSIGEFVYDDFEIKDYACAEPIKGEMAV
jgi:thymidylate synthase